MTRPTKLKLARSRIMYLENKSDGLEGPARIGRVFFSKSGNSLYYQNKMFQKIAGFKANYEEVDSGDEYWISGPRKDQNDRLYGGNKDVQIDEDISSEYYDYIKT
ncbi:MAG: 1-deoxy-D-xylulose-5-phosphate synthase [Kordiimonadales bacterium]|nr:MAG: 1-deoxy-D-xylulose-5-phosphate synthase [Kordiimonadales bacterium]